MEASKHCASRMHDNLRSAWNNLHSGYCGTPECSSDEENCMNDPDRSTTSEDIVEIFERAFKLTDDEFKETTENAEVVGSTAVTALIGARYIITGYCGSFKQAVSCAMDCCLGDSRAVLCRNKRAFPLTVDHKPERDDETVSSVLWQFWSDEMCTCLGACSTSWRPSVVLQWSACYGTACYVQSHW